MDVKVDYSKKSQNKKEQTIGSKLPLSITNLDLGFPYTIRTTKDRRLL